MKVVSLDLKNADINCDIMTWDYKVYPPKLIKGLLKKWIYSIIYYLHSI